MVVVVAVALGLLGDVGRAGALSDGLQDERARNGRILVDDDYGRIATMRPDGTGLLDIVRQDDWPGGAEWSPDKQMVAYGIYGGQGTELHLITATGQDDRYVRVADSWEWSPDGRFLAYSSTIGGVSPFDECYGIWLMDMETGESRVAAEIPECKLALSLEWSPDGREIAYIDYDDPESYDYEIDIYKADVETGTITQLTDAGGVDGNPAWAADGSWILFSSDRDRVVEGSPGGGDIYRMRPDGSEEERLTGLRRWDDNASWSPDASRIVWTRTVGKPNEDGYGGVAVHVMKADGSGVTRVTDDRRFASYGPRYSPDGRWLLFYGSPPKAKGDDYALYKSHLDGTHQTRLTRLGTSWTHSDW